MSLFAGILTFISPCILPLIPAYFSYISEISLQEMKDSKSLDLKKRFRILRSAVFFVLGFGIIFILFAEKKILSPMQHILMLQDFYQDFRILL